MGRMHNYYTRLFFVILLSVIIASGLISAILIARDVKNVQSVTENSLQASAQQKVKIYDVNIKSLHLLANSLSDNIEIKNYFEALKKGTENDGFYQILKTDLEQEIKSYSGILENDFYVYDGICYVDGIGGTSVGFDIEGEASEWYLNALNTKEPYLGKIKESPITGLPVMVSAYPILDEANNVIAMFGMSINLNGFSSEVISNTENSEEKTFIIDDSGKVIAANDISLIYNYNMIDEIPELGQFIQNNKDGITFYKKNGTQYLAAVEQSKEGVIIIQALPVSVYQEPIFFSIIISLILMMGILACVAIITIFVAKTITKPIYILVQELNAMSLGNYDDPISDELKTRKDEFSILGNALTEMKKQTSQLIMNLSLSNEEVEASLEEVIATEEELKTQNELLSDNEKQLRDSLLYNKAIINVIPDIIFILDKNGTFTDCQASNDAMLFIPRESFIGKNLKDVMPIDIAIKGYEKIKIAMESGTLQSLEYELDMGVEKQIFELRIIKCFEDGVVAIARDITNQRMYQQQIEYLSYHDQLTKLHNRRAFEEELKRIDREESLPLCLIMADVNGLKLINDSFGHRDGDMLLIKFAKVLTATAPVEEMVFRIGGDEFVIILPRCTRKEADELVETIKNNCSLETVNAVKLSVSFGWDIKEHTNESINMVLKTAEDYMYKKKLFEGPSMRGKTISLIISTLHEKNKREAQHSQRVAELCEKLAIALHMQEHKVKEIKNTGLLHDIGKIAISENLLNKPGRLTPDEFEEVKRHTEIGYRILCASNEMTEIADHVLSHHERWDGMGYPRGLAGEMIPLQSRMIAIADTFDAMTSVRSYRNPVSDEDAAKELMRNAGTQFDADLVECFVHEVLGYTTL